MALDTELETYKQKLPELSSQEGKYVLIHGEDLVDLFGTYEDALKDGYARFGFTPFLVKQIHAIEPMQFISRISTPCLISHDR